MIKRRYAGLEGVLDRGSLGETKGFGHKVLYKFLGGT